MSNHRLIIPSWDCEDCRDLAEWIRRDHPEVEVLALGAPVRPRADNARLCDRCHCRRQADDGIEPFATSPMSKVTPSTIMQLRGWLGIVAC
jgi:hypothetical protein